MPRCLTLFCHMSVFVHRCLRMPSYLRYTFFVWFLFCLFASFVSPCVLLLRPDSAEGFSSCPSTGSRNEEKDWENDSTTSSTPSNAEYTGIQQTCTSLTSSQLHQITVSRLFYLPAGPKLYKEPSAKSNKHIIQNALAHCCLAGKVNEGQKNKILDVRSAFTHLHLSPSPFIFHPTNEGGLFLCRKWRNPKPITSWCCSGILDASSGLCTPTVPRRRRSPDWPALGRGASLPR